MDAASVVKKLPTQNQWDCSVCAKGRPYWAAILGFSHCAAVEAQRLASPSRGKHGSAF
jgi:hypothetical protein